MRSERPVQATKSGERALRPGRARARRSSPRHEAPTRGPATAAATTRVQRHAAGSPPSSRSSPGSAPVRRRASRVPAARASGAARARAGRGEERGLRQPRLREEQRARLAQGRPPAPRRRSPRRPEPAEPLAARRREHQDDEPGGADRPRRACEVSAHPWLPRSRRPAPSGRSPSPPGRSGRAAARETRAARAPRRRLRGRDASDASRVGPDAEADPRPGRRVEHVRPHRDEPDPHAPCARPAARGSPRGRRRGARAGNGPPAAPSRTSAALPRSAYRRRRGPSCPFTNSSARAASDHPDADADVITPPVSVRRKDARPDRAD